MSHRLFIEIFFGLVISFLVATLTVQAAQLESAAYLRAQHRAVLQQWLAGKPGLRIATEKDCLNKEGLEATRQENGHNYQPYYAVGDFNHDGQEDFAVALINPGKRSRRLPSRSSTAPSFPAIRAGQACLLSLLKELI